MEQHYMAGFYAWVGGGGGVLLLLTAALVYAIGGRRELRVSEATRRGVVIEQGKRGMEW